MINPTFPITKDLLLSKVVYYQRLIESMKEEDKTKGYMEVLNDDNSDSSESLFSESDFLEDNMDEARIDPGETETSVNIEIASPSPGGAAPLSMVL